jgi:DNA-binding response OmpR family regulator
MAHQLQAPTNVWAERREILKGVLRKCKTFPIRRRTTRFTSSGRFDSSPHSTCCFNTTQPVRLTPKVYDLLHLLVTHHGQVVSHADCMSAVCVANSQIVLQDV